MSVLSKLMLDSKLLEFQRRLSNILWGKARFLASKEFDGRRVSLYLLNKEYYMIWYFHNDFERVDKIENISLNKIKEIFGRFY
jgi:hypothetical protein